MRISVLSTLAWPEGSSGPSLEGRLARLQSAERQGYDGVWLAEPAGPGPGVPATLAAAHLAARTERIRIGALAAWPESLHPLRLAEDVATADVVSRGRIDWGISLVGSGGAARLEERIGLVRHAWAGGRAAPAESDAMGADDREIPECVPAPVQPGGPPLFIAPDAEDSEGARWALEQGHGCLAHAAPGAEGVGLVAPRARVFRASDAVLALAVSLCIHEAEAPAPRPAASVFTGSAAACADALAALVERAAPDELIVCFDRHGDAEDIAASAQQCFVEAVAPELRLSAPRKRV